MVRKELFMRMARGERLVKTALNEVFILGNGTTIGVAVRPTFVHDLIKDGLATSVHSDGRVLIELTEKVDAWFERHGILLNPLVTV